MFLSAKYGGELLIEMQFMVLRCVPHGVTLLSSKLQDKVENSLSTGLIAKAKFESGTYRVQVRSDNSYTAHFSST